MPTGAVGTGAGAGALGAAGAGAGCVGIQLILSGWTPGPVGGPEVVGELTLLLLSYCPRPRREDDGPVGGWRSGDGGRMGSTFGNRPSMRGGGPLVELTRAVFLPRPRGPEGGPEGGFTVPSTTDGMLLSRP